MSDLDELRSRVDALEAEVARLREVAADLERLREDAAATRTLAAMADRDASEVRSSLRAHSQSLGVLRDSQLEQGEVLDVHTTTLRTIADAVGGVLAGQHRHEQALQGHTSALVDISTMLRQLIAEAEPTGG